MTTEYVTVKITGTFPMEDVDTLASFYGIGSPTFAQKEITQEEKIEALVGMAQNRLADFLSAATKSQINRQAQLDLVEAMTEVDTRVKSALQSEITTTEV